MTPASAAPSPSRASRPVAAGRRAVHWAASHGLARAAIGLAARRGDLQAELVRGGGGDPQQAFDVIEAIRARGPLHQLGPAFVTVDHGVVREVLTSPDFRTGIPGRVGGPLGAVTARTAPRHVHPLEPPSLLVTEPPQHTRYRTLVVGVFTARAVERLRARTEEIAHRLLDELAPFDPVELVAAYCSRLPVAVIAEVLGVPERDRQHVLDLGTAAASSLDLGLSWRRYQQVDAALRGFDAWLGRHLEQVRADPGEDLFSRLVEARDEDGGLDDQELKSTAALVLGAGFETTVNLLGNGTALLHAHPGQRERLAADPRLWPTAVEEVLRLDPPVLLTGRVASRDTTVAGSVVRRGNMVTTVLAGANRDPRVFADPTRFDVGRGNARDHLSFSAGRHHCLGAALARMEGEVGLRALWERYPDLRLLPGARRRDTRTLRGYERLPARWH